MANPSSGNASLTTDSPRWGRNGSLGSAFNGLSRGRGRSSGRGRGGKSTRGAGAIGHDTVEADSKPPASAEKPLPGTVKIPATSNFALSKVPSPNVPRTKVPPRHTSRNPNTTPQPPTTTPKEVPSSPMSTARPSNRRRRSHAAKGPPKDTSLKHPQKSSGNRTPHTGSLKDLPPHLTNTVDTRSNIDALVERVRAVAMADNRPSTPGSHIDWAGDDDDGLPDLDDWGVTTNLETSGTKDMISPILVDSLKPLPEPGDKLPSPLISRPSTSTGVPTTPTFPCDSVQPLTSSQTSSANDVRDASSTDRQSTVPNTSNQLNPALGGIASNLQLNAKPLHPSLPRKPVVVPAMGTNGQNGAVPMRSPLAGRAAVVKNQNDDQSLCNSVPNTQYDDVKSGVLDINVENTSFIRVPSAQKPLRASFIGDNKEIGEGLAASIHAPSKSAAPRVHDFASKFNQDTSLPNTRAPTSRFSRDDPTETGRFSRSGQTTLRGGFHSRTHSTPPTGTHRTHATRPVITGDAISRLARTIGNTGS